MLDPEYFAKTMLTLQKAYTDFNLTKEQLEVWYGFFKDCTPQEFRDMVQVFLNKSIYPPLGANHIKQVYYEEMEKQIKDKHMTPEEAWHLVRGAIRYRCPYYNPQGYIDYIKERDELAAKLAKDMIYEIREATVEQMDFLATRFKKAYEVLLQRKIEDKRMQITGASIKDLLSGYIQKLKEPEND